MKRTFGLVLFFLLLSRFAFTQCTIPVVATVNPTVVCQGQQVNLSATTTPTACGITPTCSGNVLSSVVGSGNTPQPGNGTQAPTLLGNFNKSARNQMLYLASELLPALGGPCVIKRLSFNLPIFNSSAWLENFTVKLICTNATSLNSWENNLVTVYTSASPGYQPAGGPWGSTITFQTPFAWDGVSNIVVDVCWNNPITFGNLNNKAECTNTAFNSYLYIVSNNDMCGTNNAPTVSTLRPNIRFTYCYTDIDDYNILWTPNTGINAVAQQDTSVTTANPNVTTSYIITVNDGAGCTGADTVTVQVDNSRVLAGNDVNACPGNITNLSATVLGTVIPGPATFAWTTLAGTNVGNTQNITVNPAATTTYIVTMGGGGCLKRDTVTINVGGLTVNATATNATCNGANNGSISVTSNGNAPFTYNWSANASTGNVSSAINLGPGTYNVSVTDMNGCSGTATAAITEPTAVSFTSSITNVSCFGGSNGSISLTPSGGTGSYTYQWSNSAPSNPTAGSLSAGSYTVTVRDASLCSATGSFTVTEPTQVAFGNAVIQHVNCFGGNSGRITVNVSGGTGAYTYSWSHNLGLNSSTASGLAAGSYTVTARDASLCSASASYNVIEPTALSGGAPNITPPTCFGGNNGSATVNPTGGTTPYTYLWNPSGQTTQTATGLSAQSYNVTITDDSLCTVSATVTVTQPAQITISGTVTDADCNGASTGAIDITLTNGVNPFTFSWTGGYTTEDISLVPAGNYSVTATDNTGCTQTASFTINEPTAVVIGSSPTITHVSCFGGSNGSITITASGGTPTYTYTWNPNVGSSAAVTSLAAGLYDVKVTDLNGCTATAAYIVNQPGTPLAFNTTLSNLQCSGVPIGSITVNVSGGAGGYVYTWSHNPNLNSNTASNLPAGSYSITVTDAGNCSLSATYDVTEPLPLGFGVPSITHVSCYGYTDGAVDLPYFGGTGNWTFTWNGVPGPNPQSNLAAGTYVVVMTDASNCTASASVTVNQPASFTVGLQPHDATCFSASNGYINAVPAGGTPPYIFQWSDNTANQSAMGLVAGNYSVTVRDNNSCSVSGASSIAQPNPLTFDLFTTQVKCPGDRNGTIEVRNATGGTQPYNYSATQDGSNFIFSTDGIILGLASGYYAVILADAQGCTLVDTAFVPSPVPDFFTYTTDSTSCFGSEYNDGAVHIEGTTLQNMPYQFGVDGGPLSYSGDLYNLTAGNHTVNAVNYWGCPTDITVFVPEPIEGRAEVFPEDTTIQLGQSIQLSSSFGPYPASVITSYLWSPAEGLSCIDCRNPVLTTYSRSNQYVLTVIYNGHCEATASLTVQVQDTQKVYVPNAFSPNGDGNNDEWMVYGQHIKTVNLKIFNRWGEMVFQTSNAFSGWDGTYKGELQKPDVFTYHVQITYLDDRTAERMGSIMLLR